MRFVPRGNDAKDRMAGFARLPELDRPYVLGYLERANRSIPCVSTSLDRLDRMGRIRARWGIGRMDYKVLPGLYAVGTPDDESIVLVSANYKMSFDALRKELAGLDAWILVLDTKGINVWCAAGKGTFGTAELVARVCRTRLRELVSHSTLILPQLGAPGVSASEVARTIGFTVVYGPVRAADIPAFLARGMTKDERMRRVEFTLRDRIAVAPIELVQAWPLTAAGLAAAAALALPAGPNYAARLAGGAAALVGASIVGTVAFPALLPLLPGRAFSVKGAWLGAVWSFLATAAFGAGPLFAAGLCLASAALVAYLGLNFTGATTFTSPTGARREVERGVPPMIAAMAAGLAMSAASRVFGIA